MWWFDDSLQSNNSGQPKQRFQTSFRVAAVAPTPTTDLNFLNHDLGYQKSYRKLELTDTEIAANKVLLEAGEGHEAEIKRLLNDIKSLEQVVREQKTTAEESEEAHATQLAQLQQQLDLSNELLDTSARTSEELEKTYAVEIELWEKKLEKISDDSAARETRVKESLVDIKRLRDLLVESDQQIAQRDDELDGLYLRLEATEQEFANSLAATEAEFERDRVHLNSITAAAEQRADQRLQQIQDLQQRLEGANGEHARRIELEKRVEHQSTELMSLQIDHHEMISLMAILEEELSQSNAQAEALRSELEIATNQFSDFRRDHAISWADFQDRQDATEANLKTTEDTLRQTLEELHNKTFSLDELTIELDTLRNEFQQLQSENQQLTTTANELSEHRLASQEAIAERERSHARQLATLTHQVDELKAQRDAATAERDELIAQRDSVKQIAEQAEAEKSAEKEQRKAQAEELKKAFFRLSEEATARKADTNAEVLKLTEALQRKQDESVDFYRQAKETEYDLRKQIDQLQRELAKREEDVERKSTELESKVGSLEQVLEARQQELQSLAQKTETATFELQRRGGAIDKVKQENQRLVEVHTSQFNTLQSRVDELIVALDEEKSKREVAETECRRLSIERSNRIGVLSRQRDRLMSELGELQSLKNEEMQLRTAVAEASAMLADVNETLNRKSAELDELRIEFETGRVRGSQVVGKYRTRLDHAREQIEQLTAKSVWAHRELRRCRERLAQQQTKSLDNDSQFAIEQRDRLIASLEQNAIVMQQRLQREAAARRKLESLFKREGTLLTNDIAIRDGWAKLDTQNKMERLQRQIVALKNINAVERQRNEHEVKRLKSQLQSVMEQKEQRAA